MELGIKFRNDFQKNCFWLKQRNQCASGGFNNGKSYVLCQKAVVLALTFSNYRSVIARQTFKDLKATTLQTLLKILPREYIRTFDQQSGIIVLKNGSLFYLMHLDAFDEQSLRGLEINSAFVDQAEEMDESIYLVLDSRIGRWDQAQVPSWLMEAYDTAFNDKWPTNLHGINRVPNYMFLACNPDSQFHFIYQRYHPDSVSIYPNHIMLQAPTDESLGDAETMEQMKGRDPEWVKKYYKGEWGISEAQIHYLDPKSILDPKDCTKLFNDIQDKARRYRVMDHGDSSPTACGWFAALNNWHIGYREYYMPNTVISEHRKNIFGLSVGEQYSGNWADPQIFKTTAQKDGGFWSVADEYKTKSLDGPPLYWNPADNAELSTRNRLNELLKVDKSVQHPITGEFGSPRFYLIKRSKDYPNGIFHGITELQSQRRKLLASINGKAIYSDDREDSIRDHFYDVERYYVAMHGSTKAEAPKEIPRKSFAWYNRLSKKHINEVLAASDIVN